VSYWFKTDHKMPHTRLSIVSYSIAVMMVLLLSGFWKLQIIDSEHYNQLAERNSIRSIPIIAPRGNMLDREGRVLVDSYPSFSVLLLRDDPALLDHGLPQIAEGLSISIDDLRQQVESARPLPKFQPIVIKPEASKADIAFIESHRADIPLLEMLMVHRRRYIPGGFMAHASGYVGEVSEQQVENSNGRLRPGDIVGKTGLEKQYNDTLMGVDGMRRAIVNSVGREVGRLTETEAIPGKPVQLTIDYDLQAAAEQALQGRKGSIVVLNPRNGEVLAMASRPAPDPNEFAVRIQRDQWQRLNDDPDVPLLNRSIQAQLAPGSVFKIIMATAMLESKAVPESMTVFCPGYAEFYGRQFKCWVFGKTTHGLVDFHKAIVQSCDIFFYNLGKRLGIDRISYYASHLGLGKRTGIDLPAEENGLVPSEEWVNRVYHRKWYPGETISVAVGQGAVTATPLQLARMIGGVAMGGIFKRPHLLKDAKNVGEERFAISEDTTEKVTQGMWGVVNEGGTASSAKLPGIEMSGKSGSAQVIGYDTRNKVGKKKKFKDNAWFVGYAPRRDPEIVVAVLVEEGEHGGAVGGPMARDIVKAYYDKKNGKLQQQYTAQNKQYDLSSGLPQANVLQPRAFLKPPEVPADVRPSRAERASASQ